MVLLDPYTTTNGFVKSGRFKTDEGDNANISCLKHYIYYYVYYYYLPVLIESIKDAAMLVKFGINSL